MGEIKIDKEYFLAFSKVEGLTFEIFSNLLNFLQGDFEKIFNISESQTKELGISLKIFNEIKKAFLKTNFEKEWSFLEKLGIKLLTYWDDDYPLLLRHIHNPPFVLFVKGFLPKESFNLSIVGTRKPTIYGKKIARKIAYELGRAGIVVISGLAYGIDTEAHWGCLEGEGTTIAVLGSGINRIYPSSNKKLVDAIIQGRGAVISEYHPLAPPNSWHFPQRNRIIAGLSVGVIVVEAPLKSGALITAFKAIEENREVFALPGKIDEENSQGCHLLIKNGAKILTHIRDIFEEFNLIFPKEISPQFNDSEEEKIYNLLKTEALTAEEICQITSFSPEKLASILTLMEIDGKIVNINGKYIAKK